MEFPAYVMSDEILAQDYHQIRLLDNNGAVWNVIVNTSGKSVHDCSKIVEKQVMCVNFTQEADGNWSADKNWDDAAALIEAGGYVYAMAGRSAIPFSNYVAGQGIAFHIALHNTSTVMYSAVIWLQDGLISVSEAGIPIVMYGEQTLTADQQAQARKNIGLTPVAKTDAMTQSVGLDAETGELWTEPGADAYTLPIASPTQLGGVKPVAKTDAMTKNVGVDGNGGLYTEPAAWFVTIVQTSSDSSAATADKTPQEILAAYQAGYNVYALIIVKDSSDSMGVVAPFVTGNLTEDAPGFLFSTVLSFAILANVAKTFYATNMLGDDGWVVKSFDLAKKTDIPTIPTTLPNPNALTITVGDNVVSYDGSEAKTVEIADGTEVSY